MYIPADAPDKFLQSDAPPTTNFQLYVRRVFITDEIADLIPKWLGKTEFVLNLGFVKVVIDSDDFPLNVSRETLQNHASLKIIKNRIVSKALALLGDLAESDPDVYAKIHGVYAKALRFGYIGAKTKHQELLKSLMRFHSSSGKSVSFEDYLKNRKEDQPQIYYAAGGSIDQIEASALVEKVIKRGYEVLLVSDPLEDYVLSDKLKTYKEVPLQNVAKDGLLFGDEDDESAKIEGDVKETFEPLLEWLKERLEGVVDSVRISLRLSSAPCVVVPSQMGLPANQERLMAFQNAGQKLDVMTKFYLDQKRIFEFNPYHPIMIDLLEKVTKGETEKFDKLPLALFEIYGVASGYGILNL